ncbi:ornithine carbamoyltransferase [Stereum hirsutum FP-91666 SS1]|uniref:ornithine carbamoyltransferase n=1 Tax=Stereum hirsutum (strain FP-91666) TaxID=721885 RepID=R7RWJ2_STEHR|nr:ornithine carbamoyltransferase [Stereum hirsutum FP-91666 SS1]EIM79170.1 ornithine carbamoyltransferase [Stereum hirsutum FP-91666 SS1]
MASKVPHLMTLADLSAPQILRILSHAHHQKHLATPWLRPQQVGGKKSLQLSKLKMPSQSLFNKSIALLFSKRSTRTRVAAETSAVLLGGRALFLGREDIQLGVNESPRDTARVIGGMCEGIFARVGDHSEIEELARYSPVPVLNALSSLWHPTQTLADLLTLHEHAHLFDPSIPAPTEDSRTKGVPSLPMLKPLTITYVGDSANVLHDMLVTLPRLGHKLRVATPPQYGCPEPVWARVKELGCDVEGAQLESGLPGIPNGGIWWGADPKEAVKGADVVVTDTWISMGQEAEKEERLKAFEGYQVTEALCREGGANPDWKFMHCLPRKPNEVDDEVFYGPRSLVFPEADNRKWTIMAAFDLLFGKWDITGEREAARRQSFAQALKA